MKSSFVNCRTLTPFPISRLLSGVKSIKVQGP